MSHPLNDQSKKLTFDFTTLNPSQQDALFQIENFAYDQCEYHENSANVYAALETMPAARLEKALSSPYVIAGLARQGYAKKIVELMETKLDAWSQNRVLETFNVKTTLAKFDQHEAIKAMEGRIHQPYRGDNHVRYAYQDPAIG